MNKDLILNDLIHFRSKYLLEDLNKLLLLLYSNINSLQSEINTNKIKLYNLTREINEYYKQNNNQDNKTDEPLKYFPQPNIPKKEEKNTEIIQSNNIIQPEKINHDELEKNIKSENNSPENIIYKQNDTDEETK